MMDRPIVKMKYLTSILMLIFLPSVLYADWKVEKEKIEYLLDQVARVEGVFIRNGTEYTPEQAVEHLRMKLTNAMNGWFAPKKEKWTAEMFIEKIASKSSLSGKPYQIKFNDGKLVKVAEWLREKLNERKD